MSQNVIEVSNLSKSFSIHLNRPDTVKSLLVSLMNGSILKTKQQNKLVLDDISFEVKSGEFLGIMGRNGSGKTTLLKILSGIYVPSQGQALVKQKLVPMVALGAGFQAELSGYDNIFLNAAMLGFSRDEIKRKINDVIEFSELGENIYRPLKNYSSGMVVRLGFSIAANVDSPILLLDEILAVGDSGFQKKSLAKMEELFKSGKTIILVTHDAASIKKYCNRSIVIENGKIIFDGDPGQGADIYQSLF